PLPPFPSPLPRRPALFPYTTLFRSLDRVMRVPGEHDRIRVITQNRGELVVAFMVLVVPGDPRRRHRVAEREVGDDDHLLVQSSPDRKSTRLNSSHVKISDAVFRLKK